MLWSGDWRWKARNEAPGSSTESIAARHMGIYDGLGKERMKMKLQGAHQRVQQSLGEGRMEMKLQTAQQRVEQQGIRLSTKLWEKEGGRRRHRELNRG